MSVLQPFEIHARNLPEHARNAIHTDRGAQAAGFPRALVAGVTTYAYMCHVPMAAFGLDWVASGGGEVRFLKPVFDTDRVCCVPDGMRVEAHTGTPPIRATFSVYAPDARAALETRGNDDHMRESLAPIEIRLAGEWGSDYGQRAGDPMSLCSDAGVVHPAVWPALANHVVHSQVARGSWVHLRSTSRHLGLATEGSTAIVTAAVTRRWISTDSHGRPRDERAVLDVHIGVVSTTGTRLVATVEHEAIIAFLNDD